MHQLTVSQVMPEIERALTKPDLVLAGNLLWPALNQHPEIAGLWFYAGVLANLEGRTSLALLAWEHAYKLEPNAIFLSNMGMALRATQRTAIGRKFLERALEHDPENGGILTNLSGMMVNEGDPLPGIEWGERALKIASHAQSVKFNLALLNLEAGRFVPGFDLYAEGTHRHREDRVYEPDLPLLTPELHAQLKGTGKTIVTWGEQGLGDELMFATMLNDVIRDYEIVFECHPRLELLHRTSSWARALAKQGREVRIMATRKQKPGDLANEVHAKVAIGNLCRLYRRTAESFSWQGPTYYAPMAEAQQMRAQLSALAEGRVIVGLGMRGGMVETNRHYRCVTPDKLRPLLDDDRFMFVSLDYEDMKDVHDWIEANVGPDRYYWYPSVNFAWDYHHMAALVAATDCIVTVPQSVAHISAGMGHPTHLLTPSKPDWRLTVNSGHRWHWYDSPNVRLHRQTGLSWDPAIQAVQAALQADFFQDQRKEAVR